MHRFTALLLAAFVATGCASSTVIRSKPSGATVINEYGQEVGKTPYVHEDSEMLQHRERFTLKAPGHQEQQVTIKKSKVNAVRAVGFGLPGILFFPLLGGLLWATEYPEEYNVELKPHGRPALAKDADR